MSTLRVRILELLKATLYRKNLNTGHKTQNLWPKIWSAQSHCVDVQARELAAGVVVKC